jgi:hypothetical protein
MNLVSKQLKYEVNSLLMRKNAYRTEHDSQEIFF